MPEPAESESGESEPAESESSIAVVVPVKSFDVAKGRLADALDGDERSALAKRMAAP